MLFLMFLSNKKICQKTIPEENGVNPPTRKRIISSFSTPETMRFLVLKNFGSIIFVVGKSPIDIMEPIFV